MATFSDILGTICFVLIQGATEPAFLKTITQNETKYEVFLTRNQTYNLSLRCSCYIYICSTLTSHQL